MQTDSTGSFVSLSHAASWSDQVAYPTSTQASGSNCAPLRAPRTRGFSGLGERQGLVRFKRVQLRVLVRCASNSLPLPHVRERIALLCGPPPFARTDRGNQLGRTGVENSLGRSSKRMGLSVKGLVFRASSIGSDDARLG
eukprot:2060535-Rhodomonas_salina.2